MIKNENKESSLKFNHIQKTYCYIFLFFSALIVVLYSPALFGEFLFDDYSNIVYNYPVLIKNLSPESILQACLSDVGGIRPLAYLSFGLNYYFFGIDPFSFHLVNILIHIVNSFLVFYLVKKVSEDLLPGDQSIWLPIIIATLFAVAPVQTSAVSYIVQRMASGSFLFMALSSVFLFRKKFLLAGLMWLSALGFKENAVLFPVVILLYLWIKQGKPERKFWLFTVVVLTVSVVLYFAGLNAIVERIMENYSEKPFTAFQRCITQPRVLLKYISLVFFPLHSRFSLHYGLAASESLLSPASTLWSLLIIVSVLCYGFYSKNKWNSFWILFIFISLSIESSFLPLDLAYEHRIYLPMVGISAVFVNFLFRLNLKVFVGVSVIFLIFSSYNTYIRNKQFASYESILLQDYKNFPNNPRILYNLSTIYRKKGQVDKADRLVKESFDSGAIYHVVANAYADRLSREHDVDKAVSFLKTVLKSRDINKPYMLYWKIARLYEVNGQFKYARLSYEKALEMQSESFSVFKDYGLMLIEIGHFEPGIELLKKAYKLQPFNPLINYYLARMFSITGNEVEYEKYKDNYKRLYIQSKYHSLPDDIL